MVGTCPLHGVFIRAQMMVSMLVTLSGTMQTLHVMPMACLSARQHVGL